MRLKDQTKNSILLLNRSSVIGGAVLIVLISLGLGYFIGFKTGQSGVADLEQVVEPPKKILEEKRVLESTPKTENQQVPPLPPPSVTTLNNNEKLTNIEGKKIDKEPPPIEIKKEENQEKNFSKQIGKQRIEKEDISPNPKPENKPDEKPQKLPVTTEKKVVKNTKQQTKLYTIQFGAFPNIQGAEELKKSLTSKGVSAYIVDKGKEGVYYRVRSGSFESKREADKQLILYEKKTGLKGFVTLK
ncbi:MAG TPA: hypothetical protein HPP56_04180 [Nitrospirae bacterium]|nr:hypothetical protein [Nitrospirota bacterium]